MKIEPERIVAILRQRLCAQTSPIAGYWLLVTDARHEFCSRVTEHAGGEPIVPIVVTGAAFQFPNEMAIDFVKVVDANRAAFSNVIERLGAVPPRWAVLLISRSTLDVSFGVSPVTMPEWLPAVGGTTVQVSLEDLTARADGSFRAPEARIEELSSSLYRIETQIAVRLNATHLRDRNQTAPFWQHFRRAKDFATLDEFLVANAAWQQTVRNAEAFRPSLKDGKSLVARCWETAVTNSPDALTARGRHLAAALDVPAALTRDWYEGILPVLWRPATPEGTSAARFGRHLIVSVATACQLTTAAAHADSYGKYPLILLSALSFDIRRSLAGYEEILRAV